MEKLSRVKKYENLRRQIDTNTIDENSTEKSNPVLFKKMELSEDTPPRREREFSLPKKDSDTFVNEYMDDLIRDVKQYNREKGLLQSDITEIDILNQLKNPARLRREDYVKPIEEEPKVDENTLVQSKKEIAMQIQELLKEENTSGMNVTKVEPAEETPISETIEDGKTEEQEKEAAEDLVAAQHIQMLNEQTQQMKIKIEQQEEEMNELSSDIDKTNRLLNIILLILVIALFAVIGFTVFMILRNSGRI